MSPTIATFLFELTNFLLLAGLLGWLLFKPVRGALQARQAEEQRRAEDLAARAAKTMQEREALDQEQRAFDAEMNEVRRQRLTAADQEAEAILAHAHEVAERERDRLTRTLASLERAHVERLSAAVGSATRASVARLLASLDAPDLDASLARAACRQLQHLHRSTAAGSLLIESARPLDDRSRAALLSALNGDATAATFRIVPDLVAGVRITSSQGLIDVSAAALARQADAQVREALTAESFEVTR